MLKLTILTFLLLITFVNEVDAQALAPVPQTQTIHH
jgi:hypothetical protein